MRWVPAGISPFQGLLRYGARIGFAILFLRVPVWIMGDYHGRRSSGRTGFPTMEETLLKARANGADHLKVKWQKRFSYHRRKRILPWKKNTQPFGFLGTGGFFSRRNRSKLIAVADSVGSVPFTHS